MWPKTVQAGNNFDYSKIKKKLLEENNQKKNYKKKEKT